MAKQDQMKKKGQTKKKRVLAIASGVVHVKATFNNTIVTITDPAGNTVSWSSAGSEGFKGSRKSSAYAGSVAATQAAKAAMSLGIKEVEIVLRGAGAARESVARSIAAAGVQVTAIRDMTPVPHNGCRPRKRRRV